MRFRHNWERGVFGVYVHPVEPETKKGETFEMNEKTRRPIYERGCEKKKLG